MKYSAENIQRGGSLVKFQKFQFLNTSPKFGGSKGGYTKYPISGAKGGFNKIQLESRSYQSLADH